MGSASRGRITREGFNPPRMGSGGEAFAFCTTLCDMDFNVIINPILEFLATDLGMLSADIGRVIFDLLYPANADAPVIEA